MDPVEVRRHLKQRPFRPVRIFTSDGSKYDVQNPEFTFVSRHEVVIGIDVRSGGLPQRSAYLDPIHITRIEPIVNGGRRKRKR